MVALAALPSLAKVLATGVGAKTQSVKGHVHRFVVAVETLAAVPATSRAARKVMRAGDAPKKELRVERHSGHFACLLRDKPRWRSLF